jgi:hypothetical protein
MKKNVPELYIPRDYVKCHQMPANGEKPLNSRNGSSGGHCILCTYTGPEHDCAPILHPK